MSWITCFPYHVDEVFVGLGPYSNSEEKHANEPKQQVKGEKQVLGQSRVAHFASGTKCQIWEDGRNTKVSGWFSEFSFELFNSFRYVA